MGSTGRTLVACLILLPGSIAGVPAETGGFESLLVTQVKKLTPSDAGGGQFGISLSISGDTAVVGRWIDGAGSAYVFERNAGGPDNWGQVKKLTAADAAPDDRFGCSVSISGDTVAIGAREDDLAVGVNAGSAYVFERHAGGANNWGQVKKLTAADAAPADRFGFSISLSGDGVVIGAAEDDVVAVDSGSAYVFERHAGGSSNWGQVKKLTVADGAALDNFGFSVSISGATLVVGAARGNTGAVQDTGSAYVFGRDTGGAGNWGEIKKLVATDGVGADQFGYSVSISGDTVAVGAPYNDLNAGAVDHGFVYVFERNVGGADQWGQVQVLNHSAATLLDELGYSVSIDGNRIVAGATGHDGAGASSGAAYVYERDAGGAANWGQVEKLAAADGAALDLFGTSVSVRGGTIFVGARGDADAGSNSGSAYVFYASNVSVCGDSLHESPEACDDGNTIGGDGCSADCTVAGTGVPGGTNPGGDMRASAAGSSIEVDFAPACAATDHAAYWGLGPIGPSGPEWAGSACGLGTSGTASFDPGALLPGEWLYFVIVGYDGDDEGSYGANSAQVQRPEAMGVGACDRTSGPSTCP